MSKGYLRIKVDAEDGSKFVRKLDGALKDSWRRDLESEGRHGKNPNRPYKEFYFYRRDGAAASVYGKPGCVVFVKRDDAETLVVDNIFPDESGMFTDEEYNVLQREFQKLVERTGFPSTIMNEKATLVMSAKAQEKWESFLQNANPSTGTSHPVDQRNWLEFLIIAHREECLPDAAELVAYMVETLRWEPRVAGIMAEQLEFAGKLLEVVTREE